jgi:hypothetical protein
MDVAHDPLAVQSAIAGQQMMRELSSLWPRAPKITRRRDWCRDCSKLHFHLSVAQSCSRQRFLFSSMRGGIQNDVHAMHEFSSQPDAARNVSPTARHTQHLS